VAPNKKELIMSKSKKKKRGGQVGNLNALKHGHYAKPSHPARACPPLPDHPQTLAEFSELDIDPEARMIRIMLARHIEMRKIHPPSTPEETLTDLRVTSFAVARLASLLRLRRNFLAEKDIIYSENWLEELLSEIDSDRITPNTI
jgi:hypothetical protein